MSIWQAIETAPYGDGYILTYSNHTMRVSRRAYDEKVTMDTFAGMEPGEDERLNKIFVSGDFFHTPTHWMPLPDPPTK